jgi:hypothetical protein
MSFGVLQTGAIRELVYSHAQKQARISFPYLRAVGGFGEDQAESEDFGPSLKSGKV